MSKLYIGNYNLGVKENDLVELFGLNNTKYLRETCSLNMPMNDKTGQSKGYAFVPAPKHVCDELLKLNEENFMALKSKLKRRNPKGSKLYLFHQQLKISL